MVKTRHILISALALPFALYQTALGQSLQSSFEFLKLPVSAHSSSLGGITVSVPDSNPSAYITNPAVLSCTDTCMVGLNAMTWYSGTVIAGAQFAGGMSQRSRYGFNARYVNYGKSDRTMPDGTYQGTFSSKDMAVAASVSYMLTDRLSGGASGNIICSRYDQMTAVAVGVDLGLLYLNPETGISIGISALNLGGQVKAFENTFQKLPFDIAAGVTWKMEHSPVRLTCTFDGLNRWSDSDFYTSDEKGISTSEKIRRHISLGADFHFSNAMYLAAGCNLRNRAEMASGDSKSLCGFSFGTGIGLERFCIDLSYCKYQISQNSLLMNFVFKI